MTDAKSDDFETGLLLLIFNNSVATMSGAAATLASLGSGVLVSTTPGTLTIGLYTTPGPADTGDMTTNLIVYTGYANQTLARSSAGWTVASGAEDTASNATAITFGQNSSGTPTASDVAVGVGTGAVAVLYQGNLDSTLVVSVNVNPQFAIAALAITEA